MEFRGREVEAAGNLCEDARNLRVKKRKRSICGCPFIISARDFIINFAPKSVPCPQRSKRRFFGRRHFLSPLSQIFLVLRTTVYRQIRITTAIFSSPNIRSIPMSKPIVFLLSWLKFLYYMQDLLEVKFF